MKWKLREAIHEINQAQLTTIAACGDVNRNVMCNPNPHQFKAHGEVHGWAARIGATAHPRTQAYPEIWLGEEKKPQKRGGRRADLRPDLPAAEIQGRHCHPAFQRRGRVHARPGFHRDRRARAALRASTCWWAAEWA